jgi:carbon-monoxide dehydrogenase small subunit
MTNDREVHITVNGVRTTRSIEARTLLVDFLREDLGLTGTHQGCETSQCGACVVLVDGVAAKSCTLLAVQTAGKSIKTVEGLATEESLHPVQQAFHQKHGLQCGFCTPGMVMVSVDLLNRNSDPTEEEIREALHGNICRCTGYQGIVDAVRYAAELRKSVE